MTSVPHIAPRLKIVADVLAEHDKYVTELKKFTADTFPYETVYPAIRLCMAASAPEPRKIALNVVVGLYKAFGYGKIEFLTNEFSYKTLL